MPALTRRRRLGIRGTSQIFGEKSTARLLSVPQADRGHQAAARLSTSTLAPISTRLPCAKICRSCAAASSLSASRSGSMLDPIETASSAHHVRDVPALVALERQRSLRGLIQAVHTRSSGGFPSRKRFTPRCECWKELLRNGACIRHLWRFTPARPQPRSLFMRLIHNYLFFRIPLVRQLRRHKTAPYVSVFDPVFRAFTICAAMLGLYLVSRQWDAFVVFLCIHAGRHRGLRCLDAVIKSMHETASCRLTATAAACPVGIAFMVLVPLLYTDVSDARLKSRFDQFAKIDMADADRDAYRRVRTAFWVFYPDGPFRSAAFVLAATGWSCSTCRQHQSVHALRRLLHLRQISGDKDVCGRARIPASRWRLRHLLFDTGQSRIFGPKLEGATVTLYHRSPRRSTGCFSISNCAPRLSLHHLGSWV